MSNRISCGLVLAVALTSMIVSPELAFATLSTPAPVYNTTSNGVQGPQNQNYNNSYKAVYGSGAGNPSTYESRVNVGGGYSVPIMPPQASTTAGSIGVDTGASLDCGKINWAAQLQQQMQLNAGLSDLQSLGQNAAAASESYLMASLRPTFFETIQNILKNAHAQLGVFHNSCQQMEAALEKNDPLGTMQKRQEAQKVMQETQGGTSFNQALQDASQSGYQWSMDSEIGKSSLTPSQQSLMTSFLGDVSVSVGKDGQRSVQVQVPNKYKIDSSFDDARSKIAQELVNRFTTGANCHEPLMQKASATTGSSNTSSTQTSTQAQPNDPSKFTPADRGYVNVANADGITIKGTSKGADGLLTIPPTAMSQLVSSYISSSIVQNVSGMNYPETGCGAYAYMNQIDMPYSDRQQTAAMYADAIALRGLATTIDQLQSEVNAMKIASSNKEAWSMMQDQVNELNQHYQQMKDARMLEDQQMRSQMMAKEQALLQQAQARSQQHSGVVNVLDAQSAGQQSNLSTSIGY